MDRRSEEVFEKLGGVILHEAARRYGIRPDDLVKHGSFESYVFEFQRHGRSYILKLTHSLHRTPELVEGEIEWVLHLAESGVSVCRPVPAMAGEMVEVIDGRAVEELRDDYFIAYAFEKSPGRATGRKDWDDEMIETWGQTLGRLHRATREYQPSREAIRRFHWDTDPCLSNLDYLASQPKVMNRWRETVARLKSFPTDQSGYGLIHSDLHHGNFLFSDGALHVFDCDDCHYGWFGFDIMIPLFYVMRDAEVDPEDIDYAWRFLDRFLSGYVSETSIDTVWIRRIPDFMKLREIDLYTTIVAEDAAEISGWCRRFMENRRYRIENDIPVIGLDLSEFA